MSYCGMNNVKHKEILDSMVEKGMIKKIEESWGAKIIIKYNISEKGSMILKEILEPFLVSLIVL
jgi:predicted transcriptional regulator